MKEQSLLKSSGDACHQMTRSRSWTLRLANSNRSRTRSEQSRNLFDNVRFAIDHPQLLRTDLNRRLRVPLSPAPQIPARAPSLRSGHFLLTKPNTSCTIITPASLRSDCCSPSLRNAVRLPSGTDVHLHRNTQSTATVTLSARALERSLNQQF